MNEFFELQKITAGYGANTVVRDVSLKIEHGQFCALLGLNGSGKTTLLKAVCGLLPIRDGRCLVDGLDCTQFHERKRAQYISYIPQRCSKMQGVSVLDVVLMGLNPHLGLLESPSRADTERAKALLAKVGIDGLAEQNFAKLSEGQKQLVVFTRSLLQDAPVMLLDEPDSALDFLNRHRILKRMRELIHKENKVGLITLHDPNFALAYCDQLILMLDGEIAAQLTLRGASKQSISESLSIIYGNIAILEHDGHYMMLAS